jgi:catechol 2,3-dioxygenase-like lactoylglutathione lyase family enzyme
LGRMDFGFDCVFYYVSDLDRAVDFYADVLGFKLKSRDVVARFEVDGTMLELVPTHDKSKLQGDGNGRFCLRVDEITSALDALRSRGVAVSGAQPKRGGILASFYDPDGNEICLWQYREGSHPELSL